MKKFIAVANDQGRTILKFLEKMLTDVPNARLERAFRGKDIKLNGVRIKDKTITIKEGDEIVVYGIESSIQKVRFKPVQQKFTVVYEDKNILVVNKKEGDSIHGEFGCLDDQVLNYLRFKQTSTFVPSSIGRIDKVTSGIVVYAKNYMTLRTLKEHIHDFKKIYIFKSDLPKETTTTFKIDHNEELKREVCGDVGKDTKTIFFFDKTRKLAELVTGRKHQIRASLSKLGYPIYGDRRYGGKPAERVFLHSFSILFNSLEGELKYLNNMEIMSKPT